MSTHQRMDRDEAVRPLAASAPAGRPALARTLRGMLAPVSVRGASLAARLGRLRVARRPAGDPRVLVIGVCQGEAIARAMACLAPDASVTFLSAFAAARRYPTMRALLAEVARHDAVFSNVYLPPFRDGGTIADLRARGNVALVPTIVFPAFHPDLVHVGWKDVGRQDAGRPDPATLGGLIQGPMGASHSALTLFGYLGGLSPEEVLALFRREVFERVGYFDVWDASVRHLRQLGAQAGHDLDGALVRWARRGCFMHSVDHVKLHVAADLARGALARAGIPHHAVELDAFMPDDLGEAGCWPVYPEIADHYGVPGSALFRRPGRDRGDRGPTVTLRAFVEASFSAYARQPRADLACARVAGWLADSALREDLLGAGIRGRAAIDAAQAGAGRVAARLTQHGHPDE